MNWIELHKKHPKAYNLMEKEFNCLYIIATDKVVVSDWSGIISNLEIKIKHPNKRDLYDFFDEQGIRVFINYATSNGTWNYEFRVSKDNNSWEMSRIGNICAEGSRSKAETEAFTKAFEILNDRLK